jgi:hypothetical protein
MSGGQSFQTAGNPSKGSRNIPPLAGNVRYFG